MGVQPYYEDDSVTIYHGDCREITEWLAADVMVTDPPYGMSYTSGWNDRTIANDDSTSARDAAIEKWGGVQARSSFWPLGHSTPGCSGKRSGSIVRHDRLTGNTKHPNEKPVSLLAKLIQRCPLKPSPST